MKRMIYICLVLMAASSCLSRDFTEQKPYISIDTGTLTVPSDVVSGNVCDTLYVTSNRNWSAVFAEDVDWVRMAVNGNENLAGASKITALPLEFDNNESYEDRSVQLIVSYDSLTERVAVVQEAKSHRLSLVEVSPGLDAVSADGGRFDISFYCNTQWKARVDYTDGMILSLSADQGDQSSTISVTVNRNDDPDKGKKAVITLSADGCQDIDILLIQQHNE